MWLLYLCLRLQVVGLRGESVVLSLLFFFLNFVGNSHLEGIFVEVITFDAEAFLQTLKTIEACRLHGIPG